MLDPLFDWMGDRLERWKLINVGLVTALLAMVGEPPLISFIGGVALVLLGMQGAVLAKRELSAATHPFDVALHWAPGAVALLLAAAGLWLATDGGQMLLGLAVFALHAGLLVWQSVGPQDNTLTEVVR